MINKLLIACMGTTGLAVLLLTGCQPSDTESTDTSATRAPSQTAEPTIEETVTQSAETTKQVAAEVEEIVQETAETAERVVSEANAKVQEILTQAQTLVGEQKYEDAAKLLQELANFELTPEQQQVLDDLKAAIQKGLESDAVKEGTKAINNLLGGDE